MKLRATVLGALLIVLFSATISQAIKLSAPHNLDNGIRCYHCHSADPSTGADYWFDAIPSPGPDDTTYNWVCLRCHNGAASTDQAHIGPQKVTHSTTTTASGKAVSFTTECVDCHDPHWQDQISWAQDAENIYIAQGTFKTTPAPTYDPNDIYGPLPPGAQIPDNTKFGGPYGTTTLTVTLPNWNVADQGNPTLYDWTAKGLPVGDNSSYKGRSADNSRGLLMVPNLTLATQTGPLKALTFEIVSVGGQAGNDFVVKVNGDITAEILANGQPFGVIYGGGVRKEVSTPSGPKPVKFYNPKKNFTDAPGGAVDTTLATAAPSGICQVCHSPAATAYYDATAPESSHHVGDGTLCSDCHDVMVGAPPRLNHTSIIHDSDNCSACHIGYAAAPDTAHYGNSPENACQTCHMLPAPTLSDGTTTNNVGARDIPWVNDGTSHPGNWAAFDCINCHSVAAGNTDHTVAGGLHPNAANMAVVHDTKLTASPSFCVSVCHGTLTTVSSAQEIVNNAASHGGTCTLCHDTLTPAPVLLKALAEPGRTGANCQDCHGATYFNNHSHATAHAISNVAPCDGCHDAGAPAGVKASVAPYIGTDEVHATLGCLTCHSATDGSPIGSAAVGWAGGNWAAPASGNCVTCHGAYFNSHTHSHDVSFNSAVDMTTGSTRCYTCHDDALKGKGTLALGTWPDIIVEHETVATVSVNACQTCHFYTNADAQNTPDPTVVFTVITNNSSVTCITCHVTKNTLGHGSHTDTEFGWNDTTRASCGSLGRVAGACHQPLALNSGNDVVINVHGRELTDTGLACFRCHVDAAGNNYARKTAQPDGNPQLASGRDAVCTECHTATIPAIHHANDGTVAYTPVIDNCVTCHNVANGIDGVTAADHRVMIQTRAEIIDVQKSCAVCHSAAIPVDGSNPPVSAANDQVHDYCKTCHQIDGSNIVTLVAPIGSADVMDDNGTAPLVNSGDGGGPCTDCHTQYFEAHTHHNVVNLVSHDPTPDQSWAGQPCTDCHHDQNGVADPLALDIWAEIKYEHDRHDKSPSIPVAYDAFLANTVKDGVGSCVNCHYHDSREGINTVKFAGKTTVAEVVAAGVATTCIDCHYGKNVPLVHGLTYINHLELNTTGEANVIGTYFPISQEAQCMTCHLANKDAVAGGVPDVIKDVHKNPSCDICHTSQPNLKGDPVESAPPDFAQFGGSTVLCSSCHQSGIALTTTFHAMLASETELQNRHNYFADSDSSLGVALLDCLACHSEMYDAVPATHMDKKISRHASCGTCHDPANSGVADSPTVALTVISENMQSGSTPAPQSCEQCHVAPGAAGSYRLHYLDPGVNTESLHNITLNYADCKDCHAIASQAQILDLHNTSDCLMCHAAANDVTVPNIYTVIRNGSSTGIANTVNCRSCHVAANSTTGKLHGLNDADVALAHDKIASGGSGDTLCSNCHDMTATPELKIIQMHTVTTNPGTVGSCLTCHNPAVAIPVVTDPATNSLNAIATGWSGGGANQKTCDNCHGTATYKMHGLAFDATMAGQHQALDFSSGTPGTETDCAECHTMTNDLEQLQLHSALTNPCSACHTAADAPSTASAAAIIAAGWNNTPTLVKCEGCHAAKGDYTMHGLTDDNTGTGVVDVHNKMDIQAGAANVQCAGCHAIATQIQKVQLHTRDISPTTCLDCHKTAGAARLAVINASVGTSLIPAYCTDCHGTYFDSHIHHATFPAEVAINSSNSPETIKCNGCHVATTTPFITGSTEVHFTAGCGTCHDLTTEGVGVNNNGELIAGSSSVAGGGECIACHGTGSAYFDSHTIRGAGTAGHITAQDPSDLAQVANQLCSTATCHDGFNADGDAISLNSWHDILGEHDNSVPYDGANSCDRCHTSGRTEGNASGTINPAFAIDQSVLGVIANAEGFPDIQCLDCHWDKRTANGDHGGHLATDFQWDATSQVTCGATACHSWVANDNPLVVGSVHPLCTNCHTNSSGGNGTLKADINVPRAPTMSAANVDTHTETCTVCHSGANFFDSHLHDHTTEIQANTATALNTENCVGCHDGGGPAPFTLNVNDAHKPAGCATCHDLPLGGGKDGTRIAGGSMDNFVLGGAVEECNQCHTGYFDSHSHSHATTLTYVPATDIGQSSKPCQDCHGTGAGPYSLATVGDIYYEHDVVDGTKDTSGKGSCQVCHDANKVLDYTGDAGTPPDATVMLAITSNATTTCVTCHAIKEVNSGSPGHGGHDNTAFPWTTPAGTVESCGTTTCHNAGGANADVTNVLHGNVCAKCHLVDGDSGRLGPNQTGDSRLATSGASHTENCNVCHDVTVAGSGSAVDHRYPTQFGTAHLRTTDHDGLTAPSTETCMSANACHQGTTSAEVATVTHSACTNCHTNTTNNGTLRLGANSNGTALNGGGNCLSCHAVAGALYFTDYLNHDATRHVSLIAAMSTGSANCISGGCHDEADKIDVVPTGTGVHDRGADSGDTYACLLCHTATTGVLLSGTTGDATGNITGCVGCHSSHATNWDTGHSASGTNYNHTALTASGGCATAKCHTGNIIDTFPTTTGPGVHDRLGNASATYACDLCHGADGTLQSGTNGTAVGGAPATCASCHAAYDGAGDFYAGHVYSTPHTVISMTGADPASTGCRAVGCHDEANLIGSPGVGVHDRLDNASATYSCDRCHDTTNTGALKSFALTGDPASFGDSALYECLDCHAAHNSETDHNNISKSANSPDCFGCHAELGAASGYTFVGGIDELHTRTAKGGTVTCNSCHGYVGVRTGTDSTAVSDTITLGKSTGTGTSGVDYNVTVTCTDCHVYATIHDFSAYHNMTGLETGKYESEGLSCGRCHHPNTAIEHATGDLVTWECTDYTLTASGQAACETAGEQWGQYGVARSKIAGWTQNTPGDACKACHDDGMGGGKPSIPEVDAAITLGKSTGGNSLVACYNCHNTSNNGVWNYDPDGTGPIVINTAKYGAGYTIPGGHHDGTQVQSGNCTYCHTDPRSKMGFPTPAVLPCKECHADENASGSFTIYKMRNRSQNDGWDTKNTVADPLTGNMVSTFSFGAACSITGPTSQATCETAGGFWQPARPIANTDPAGTCNSDAGFDNDKDGCLNTYGGGIANWLTDGGGVWTDADDASVPNSGLGVDHQWTIQAGRGSNPGQVQSYGMCIFCHKMQGYHALKLPAAQDVNSSAYDKDWRDGYSDALWWFGPGRSRMAMFQESAGYPNAYYNNNPYKGSQSGDKSFNKNVNVADGYPLATFFVGEVDYNPQRICSDSRWKTYNACNTNGGTWDHGDQAKKYIPAGWRIIGPGNLGGTSTEVVNRKMVPIFDAAPTIDTLTNSGSAKGTTTDNVSGMDYTGTITSTYCTTGTTCDVTMVVAGIEYPMTHSGGGTWTRNTGNIANIGSVQGKENLFFVSVRKSDRATIGFLDVKL